MFVICNVTSSFVFDSNLSISTFNVCHSGIIFILNVLQCTGNVFRVVLGWAYRGLTGGFLLLQNFSVAISVSPHVCFILVLILISMFLR